MKDIDSYLLLGCFAVLAGVLIWWHFVRSHSLLEGWAHRNRLRIVQRQYRYFFRGPFFWTTSKSQSVYRVTVEDEDGNQHSGWVRVGGWFLGMWSDNVEVHWD